MPVTKRLEIFPKDVMLITEKNTGHHYAKFKPQKMRSESKGIKN